MADKELDQLRQQRMAQMESQYVSCVDGHLSLPFMKTIEAINHSWKFDHLIRKQLGAMSSINLLLCFFSYGFHYRVVEAAKIPPNSRKPNRIALVNKRMWRTQFWVKLWIRMHGLDVRLDTNLFNYSKLAIYFFRTFLQSIRWKSANLKRLKWSKEWFARWHNGGSFLVN